jgi:hypothetical protein
MKAMKRQAFPLKVQPASLEISDHYQHPHPWGYLPRTENQMRWMRRLYLEIPEHSHPWGYLPRAENQSHLLLNHRF